MPLPSGQRAIIAPPLAGRHQRVPSAQFIIQTAGHAELGLTLQRGVDAVEMLNILGSKDRSENRCDKRIDND